MELASADEARRLMTRRPEPSADERRTLLRSLTNVGPSSPSAICRCIRSGTSCNSLSRLSPQPQPPAVLRPSCLVPTHAASRAARFSSMIAMHSPSYSKHELMRSLPLDYRSTQIASSRTSPPSGSRETIRSIQSSQARSETAPDPQIIWPTSRLSPDAYRAAAVLIAIAQATGRFFDGGGKGRARERRSCAVKHIPYAHALTGRFP
jgi:hypothetical protein